MLAHAALLLDERPGTIPGRGIAATVRVAATASPAGVAPTSTAPTSTVRARVAGNALEALDVRNGDHVVLLKGRTPEFGDLAALHVDGGATTLWKVYPEGDHLHVSDGLRRWTLLARDVEAVGVVVAVLRRFD